VRSFVYQVPTLRCIICLFIFEKHKLYASWANRKHIITSLVLIRKNQTLKKGLQQWLDRHYKRHPPRCHPHEHTRHNRPTKINNSERSIEPDLAVSAACDLLLERPCITHIFKIHQFTNIHYISKCMNLSVILPINIHMLLPKEYLIWSSRCKAIEREWMILMNQSVYQVYDAR
jgi:hypothetical protein